MAKQYYPKSWKPKSWTPKPAPDYSRCSSITLQGSRCKMPIVMNRKCIYHQFKKRSSRRGSRQMKLRNFR